MATLTELQTELTNLEAARDKALTAQAYGIGDRNLRRPDLKVILDRIDAIRIAIARVSGASTSYPRFWSRS